AVAVVVFAVGARSGTVDAHTLRVVRGVVAARVVEVGPAVAVVVRAVLAGVRLEVVLGAGAGGIGRVDTAVAVVVLPVVAGPVGEPDLLGAGRAVGVLLVEPPVPVVVAAV
ncbi:MAG: hypothetical protein ACK559_32855, partial [bacterium]